MDLWKPSNNGGQSWNMRWEIGAQPWHWQSLLYKDFGEGFVEICCSCPLKSQQKIHAAKSQSPYHPEGCFVWSRAFWWSPPIHSKVLLVNRKVDESNNPLQTKISHWWYPPIASNGIFFRPKMDGTESHSCAGLLLAARNPSPWCLAARGAVARLCRVNGWRSRQRITLCDSEKKITGGKATAGYGTMRAGSLNFLVILVGGFNRFFPNIWDSELMNSDFWDVL